MKYSILLPLFSVLLLINACRDQKDKENANQKKPTPDSFHNSLSNMKSYVRQLDSALIKTSILQELINDSDSAKKAIRSRDQDMVRIYKIEEPPLVDTLPESTDLLVQEATSILNEARTLLESARQQIKSQQQLIDEDTLNSNQKVSLELQAQIKAIEELILKIENEAKILEGETEEIQKQ